MKKTLLALLLAAPVAWLQAQTPEGGISPEVLAKIKAARPATEADRALRNALAGTSINQLATLPNNPAEHDTYFSHRVRSKGITDQKSSGRCWLFSGLNVMRARMIEQYGLGAFEFSQAYCFFYDQLEKANLFLQATVDLADRPMSDQTVEWLFKHPLSDGGTFTGVADIVSKYGLVPAEAMPETNSSSNTSRMASLISLKLKEYGLQLRDMVARGAKADELEREKTAMLGTVYRMLVLNLGMPPAEFDYVRKDAKGNPVIAKADERMAFYEGSKPFDGRKGNEKGHRRPNQKVYDLRAIHRVPFVKELEAFE